MSRESGAGVQAEKLPRALLEPGSAVKRCRNQWQLRTVFSGVLCLGHLFLCDSCSACQKRMKGVWGKKRGVVAA